MRWLIIISDMKNHIETKRIHAQQIKMIGIFSICFLHEFTSESKINRCRCKVPCNHYLSKFIKDVDTNVTTTTIAKPAKNYDILNADAKKERIHSNI